MATLDTVFRAMILAVSGTGQLADNRLFVGYVPRSAGVSVGSEPYGLIEVIAETGNPHLTGTSSIAESLVQLSIIGRTKSDVVTTCELLRVNLDGTRMTVSGGQRIKSVDLASSSDEVAPMGDGSESRVWFTRVQQWRISWHRSAS